MSELRDADGNRLIRTRDGDLIPIIEPEPDPLPDYPPEQPCEQHTTFGYFAATCRDCISEIKAGERPRRYLGRTWPNDERTP